MKKSSSSRQNYQNTTLNSMAKPDAPELAVSIVPFQFEAFAASVSEPTLPTPDAEITCPQCGRRGAAMSTKLDDVKYRYSQDLPANDREEEEQEDMPRRFRKVHAVTKLLVSALAGLVFGIALEKGRVFEPELIRKQMLFTNFTMLKMFLSAMATGMLSFGVMSMIPATSVKMDRAFNEFRSALKTKSILGAGVGGFILGCGMTLSGACPGMVLAQVGANVPNAGFTLLGGMVGTFLFAALDRHLARFFLPKKPYPYVTLDEYLETPYHTLAIPFAALVATVVFAVEIFVPWTSEVVVSGSGLMGSSAWPPYVAGILIGSLQIPIVLAIKDTLGSATAFVTIASQSLVVPPFRNVFPYLKKYRYGVINWWQVFYVSTAILGAHFSAQASDTVGSINGVSFPSAFGGGVLLLFGSRLAGGCTSGHGLSGTAMTFLLSFVAVPSMFAGGIGLAMLLKHGLQIDIDSL